MSETNCSVKTYAMSRVLAKVTLRSVIRDFASNEITKNIETLDPILLNLIRNLETLSYSSKLSDELDIMTRNDFFCFYRYVMYLMSVTGNKEAQEYLNKNIYEEKISSSKKIKTITFKAIFNSTANKISALYRCTDEEGLLVEEQGYVWDATNPIRNEKNKLRSIPDAVTMPLNGVPNWYYTSTFPHGTWIIQHSVPKGNDEFGKVFIPTTAHQFVSVYGPYGTKDNPLTKNMDENGKFVPVGSQDDSGYGLHFSKKGNTLGCIKINNQNDAEEIAKLSDAAIATGVGNSVLIVK